MQAYEFPAHITADGKLELPADVLPRSLGNQSVRVIVLVNDTDAIEDEEADWQAFTATQFLAGYDDADAIYDEI